VGEGKGSWMMSLVCCCWDGSVVVVVSLSFLRADLAAQTTSLHVLGGCVGVIIAIYGLCFRKNIQIWQLQLNGALIA